ncbi:hypothetical protein PG988_006788 [Apiospora saccharicola]
MSSEPQSSSAFLLVPLEIRRAVYANMVDTDGIHITLSPDGDGRVRLTRCLNPDLGAEHVGLERKPDGDDPNNQIWCRRLASGWGSTSTPTPSSETDGDSAAELQTGAAIGIGIGVTLAFVALVAAAVFIFVWMRRRQRNRKRSAEPASSLSPTKPEAHSDVPVSSAPSPPHDFVPNYQYTRALGYELDAREPAPEFPVDRHNTPEMPAQSPRGFRS